VSGYPIDYSPDGKKIAYTSYEGFNDRKDTGPQKDAEIYTIGVHGKNRVQLTNNATNDYFPDYSPDGRRIAFSGSGEKSTNIYTISAGGGDKTKVTVGADSDYSPDGKKIVYYKGNDLHGKIYTINLDGGGTSKVTEGSNPAWGSRP
jgi:Tol biopolymer transport system component